ELFYLKSEGGRKTERLHGPASLGRPALMYSSCRKSRMASQQSSHLSGGTLGAAPMQQPDSVANYSGKAGCPAVANISTIGVARNPIIMPRKER
ncbi:MAG: hypothetical protein ACTHOU_18550, partial [Aureliella sp.]